MQSVSENVSQAVGVPEQFETQRHPISVLHSSLAMNVVHAAGRPLQLVGTLKLHPCWNVHISAGIDWQGVAVPLQKKLFASQKQPFTWVHCCWLKKLKQSCGNPEQTPGASMQPGCLAQPVAESDAQSRGIP